MAESFNHFQGIAEEFHRAISQTVRKVAFDLQGHAASNAPVDTGFLRNSIYVRTYDDSTYGRSGDAPHEGTMLPEVEKPENNTTAYVAVGASYGIYQEFGTRFMPAKPYIIPAVVAVAPGFEAALGAIERKLKEVSG